MTENEPRIIFRVDEKTWELYNDKRHKDKATWQSIGEKLWADWFSQEKHTSKKDPSLYPQQIAYDGTHILRAIDHANTANKELSSVVSELKAVAVIEKDSPKDAPASGSRSHKPVDPNQEAVRHLNQSTRNLDKEFHRNAGEIVKNAKKPRKSKRPDTGELSSGTA